MPGMNKMDVLGLLQEHGAIIAGHFQLPSGLHTPVYLQTAQLLQHPHVAQRIAKALAHKFPAGVDVVVSPGLTSLVLGQEVARIKKCRAIFAEGAQGMMGFHRNFKIERGEKALIVEDVITTGRYSGEVVALAAAYGAKIVGVGTIVDRSVAGLTLAVPMRSLISYPLQVSPPDTCSQCKEGQPLQDMGKQRLTVSQILEGE